MGWTPIQLRGEVYTGLNAHLSNMSLEITNKLHLVTSSLLQVTVTDEDTQSQVELDFSTPSPPLELAGGKDSHREFSPIQRKIDKELEKYNYSDISANNIYTV